MIRTIFPSTLRAKSSLGALAVATVCCLSPVSAFAQSQISLNGGAFATQPSAVVTVNQATSSNAAAVVQLDVNPDALLTQTGFYNRAAVIQMGANASSTTKLVDSLQTGSYNRLLVIQGPGGLSNTQTNVQGPASAQANYSFVSQGAATLSLEDAKVVAQNFIYAPELARVNVGVLEDIAVQFSSALENRLDLDRSDLCGTQPGKAGCPSQPFFISLDYGQTDRKDDLGLPGYRNHVRSAVIGANIQAGNKGKFGIAGSFSDTGADIHGGMGTVNTTAYQIGVFASLASPSYHFDLITTLGKADFSNSRFSGANRVSSSTDGWGLTSRVQAGYTFAMGGLRVGPVASVTFVKGAVQGYSETGSIWLTQRVGRQEWEDLFGTVGAEARYGDAASKLSSYLKVELEYDFGLNNPSVVTTVFDFAPTQQVYTPLSGGRDDTYAKISGGVSYIVVPKVRLSLTGRGIVGSDRLDRFDVMGGLAFAF